MKKRDDGGSAFPRTHETKDFYGRTTVHLNEGMSLRDYFAGQSLAAWPVMDRTMSAETLALYCYGMADAMLAARTKEPTVANT